MMFCGRKDCSRCKFFKRDGCVTVPDCAYKDLMEKLEKAKEALKFYAADENYYMHGTYGNTNVRNDNGKIAKECLNALHVD